MWVNYEKVSQWYLLLLFIYEAIYISWYCGHWHINKRIDKIHFLMECKETLPVDNPDDPFYSESNMKHLAAVIADAEAGRNMAVHELINDEEL